jgi:hypothetical protein
LEILKHHIAKYLILTEWAIREENKGRLRSRATLDPFEVKGTLLTELNNSDKRIIILKSGTPKEVLCPGRRDLMLQEPFITLSSEGLKSVES